NCDAVVPIGQARVARGGADVTIATIGSMVPVSIRAADKLAGERIQVEVIDLRSIQPPDTSTVVKSVKRTKHLVTIHESWVTAGLGAEIAASVAEASVSPLRVIRVGTQPVPTPSGKVRPHALPNLER